MRILHLCLSCFYIDGYGYQENILPRIHQEEGHDVLVIASTETYKDNVNLGYLEPNDYITVDGIHVIRIPYRNLFFKTLTHKIRKYKGLYAAIEKFDPDMIMAHGLSFASVNEVVRYKQKHSGVRFCADTHSAYYNSGRNWISIHFLHRLLYKHYIKKAIPYLDRYYYIGVSEKKFSVENYQIPESVMEYLPLGGTIPEESERIAYKQEIRENFAVKDEELVFTHSGKLAASKRTDDLLNAFISVPELKAKLLIIGSIPEQNKKVLEELINKDERVYYVGWKRADELKRYLCASDLYCQPGIVSATLHQAICCSCPVMCYPHESYIKINNMYDNLMFVETTEDMIRLFREIAKGKIAWDNYQSKTRKCATELLDYRMQAKKIITCENKK